MLPTTTRRTKIPSGSSLRDLGHRSSELGDTSKAKRNACSRLCKLCFSRVGLCTLLVAGLLLVVGAFVNGSIDFTATEKTLDPVANKIDAQDDSMAATKHQVLLTQMHGMAAKHQRALDDSKAIADQATKELQPCQAALDVCRRQGRNTDKKIKTMAQTAVEQRERVKALTAELEETKRSLEAAKTIAKKTSKGCVPEQDYLLVKEKLDEVTLERDALLASHEKIETQNGHLHKALQVVKGMKDIDTVPTATSIQGQSGRNGSADPVENPAASSEEPGQLAAGSAREESGETEDSEGAVATGDVAAETVDGSEASVGNGQQAEDVQSNEAAKAEVGSGVDPEADAAGEPVAEGGSAIEPVAEASSAGEPVAGSVDEPPAEAGSNDEPVAAAGSAIKLAAEAANVAQEVVNGMVEETEEKGAKGPSPQLDENMQQKGALGDAAKVDSNSDPAVSQEAVQ